jgi:hypothetical protein
VLTHWLLLQIIYYFTNYFHSNTSNSILAYHHSGADINVTDNCNVSPVMVLAYSDEWSIIEKLIREHPVNLNYINLFDNWTILHIAAASEVLDDRTKFILDSANSYINYQ